MIFEEHAPIKPTPSVKPSTAVDVDVVDVRVDVNTLDPSSKTIIILIKQTSETPPAVSINGKSLGISFIENTYNQKIIDELEALNFVSMVTTDGKILLDPTKEILFDPIWVEGYSFLFSCVSIDGNRIPSLTVDDLKKPVDWQS